MKVSRSFAIKAIASSLVLAAAGTASVAQAGVAFSIGASVPGVAVAATNVPYGYGYRAAYVAPAPVVVAPAPVVVAPPVVYAAPVVYPAPVYYGAPVVGVNYYYGPAYYGHGHGHWHGHGNGHWH